MSRRQAKLWQSRPVFWSSCVHALHFRARMSCTARVRATCLAHLRVDVCGAQRPPARSRLSPQGLDQCLERAGLAAGWSTA
eukprot:14030648-Alexandrium_andersonii.AAC.1